MLVTTKTLGQPDLHKLLAHMNEYRDVDSQTERDVLLAAQNMQPCSVPATAMFIAAVSRHFSREEDICTYAHPFSDTCSRLRVEHQLLLSALRGICSPHFHPSGPLARIWISAMLRHSEETDPD